MGIINDKYVSPRKALAMGGSMPTGDYGVEQLASKAVNGPSGVGNGHLKDHERTAGPPIGGNQANPKH